MKVLAIEGGMLETSYLHMPPAPKNGYIGPFLSALGHKTQQRPIDTRSSGDGPVGPLGTGVHSPLDERFE